MSKARKIAATATVACGLWWLFFVILRYQDPMRVPPPPELLALAVLLPLMAILGGILLPGRPAVGRTLMLISGIGGFSVSLVLAWLNLCYWMIYLTGLFPPLPLMGAPPISPALIIGVSGAVFLVSWKKPSRATIGSLLLGIIAGLFSSDVRFFIDDFGGEFLVLALLFSFMGIAGAVLAPARSRIAWKLMLVGGIGCFLTACAVFPFEGLCCNTLLFASFRQIPASFFLISGSILAFISLKERPAG